MSRQEWWKEAVFYQVYLRSFADSNNDGIGDLPGLYQKIPYLVDLGVDAIWLSPHYPSPMFDCGYDVADYTAVAGDYGTLDDFRSVLEELHQHGIRLVLDLVLNHTSDQHSWFLESRSSRDHPRRDWYIWRDGKDGNPPNNWYSWFGGSAWDYDPRTGQYYYHFFFKQQPDLNWRNPQVKEALFRAARFWLDMGVDGFRLDALGMLYETEELLDHKAQLTQEELYRLWGTATGSTARRKAARESNRMFAHQMDLAETVDLLKELRQLVAEYPGRVLLGETEKPEYHGSQLDALHLLFNFPLLRLRRLTPSAVRHNQAVWHSELPPGAWPCFTLGNHDTSRLATRYGSGSTRTAAALLLTLKGTPVLYYGDEIGQKDVALESMHQIHDNLALWAYTMEQSILGAAPRAAFEHAAAVSRDPCRGLMQWTSAPNHGFCSPEVNPWRTPQSEDQSCVSLQEDDPGSLLNLYRTLIRIRKQTAALLHGEYMPIPAPGGILAFLRRAPEQACLVAMNMAGKKRRIETDWPVTRPIFLYNALVERATSPQQKTRITLESDGLLIYELDLVLDTLG
jgi:alpha-glucosidase